MPAWLLPILQLALQFGLPWLESHLSPVLVQIIEQIIALLKGASDKPAMMAKIKASLDSVQA